MVLRLSSDEKGKEVPGRVVQVRPDTVTWSCRLVPTPGRSTSVGICMMNIVECSCCSCFSHSGSVVIVMMTATVIFTATAGQKE